MFGWQLSAFVASLAIFLNIPALCLLFLANDSAFAQTKTVANENTQIVEQGYVFDNLNPAYPLTTGPNITIDRSVSPYVGRGLFDPFRILAESDGFNVTWLDTTLDAKSLAVTDILVVANAYFEGGALDYHNFSTLDAPSVYSDEQIKLINDWVREGGKLLLTADHSPFAGGTIKLAESFGFIYMTGFAIHRESTADSIFTHVDFRRDGKGSGLRLGVLKDHPITNGETGRANLDHFYTFGGQAILPPAEAISLMQIPNGYDSLLTVNIRSDFDFAARIDSSGFSQGAVMELGKGRIAIFGETGAFTSQIRKDGNPMGFLDPQADQNEEFVLATLRWLAGFKP